MTRNCSFHLIFLSFQFVPSFSLFSMKIYYFATDEENTGDVQIESYPFNCHRQVRFLVHCSVPFWLLTSCCWHLASYCTVDFRLQILASASSSNPSSVFIYQKKGILIPFHSFLLSFLLLLFSFISIAGMVRTEYDTSSTKEMALRTSLLFKIAKELKWLSDTFNLCIVVINQVFNLTNYLSSFITVSSLAVSSYDA